MAELLIDLKTKLHDLETLLPEFEVRAEGAVGEEREYQYWYLGLRQGQGATFEFVIDQLERPSGLDRY